MNIELLEPRIAPANFTFNPALRTVSWTDFDGDAVTFRYSIGDTPLFEKSDAGAGLIVNKIVLAPTEHSFGTFSIAVKRGPKGDGRVDMGRLDATNVPLKSWTSPLVDIAEFDAGNGTKGVGALITGGLGTQSYFAYMNSDGDGISLVSGESGPLMIKGDVADTRLLVNAGTGKVKSFTITGNVRGDVAGDGNGSVRVICQSIGPVVFGGSIIGGINGVTGKVNILGKVTSVLVKGSIIGGPSVDSGFLEVGGLESGPVTVLGSVIGSDGFRSGFLIYYGPATLTIGGSIHGGSEGGSGVVTATGAKSVLVKGSVIGGRNTTSSGAFSGFSGVLNIQYVKTVTVLGDLIAGTYESGSPIAYSGSIYSDQIGTVTIKGSMIGNADNRAMILGSGNVAPLPVPPAGNYNALGKVSIGKDVIFGYIAAGHSPNGAVPAQIGAAEFPDAGIGSVSVGGNWYHSSLSAGINDADSNGIDDTDTRSEGDPARHAIIGPIVIKGFIASNPGLGFSGFASEKLVSLIAGGYMLFKSGDPARSLDRLEQNDVFEI